MKIRIIQNIFILFISLFLFWALGEITARAVHINDKLLGYDHKIFQRDENVLLRYGFRPNYEGAVAESIFRINSYGFRDFEYTKKKAPGVYRIAVLGDSVTAGMGVKLTDSYPKVLERLLNEGPSAYEVLNFGINGYNLAQEAELFKSRVLEFNPDMVIVGYNLNDVRSAYGINRNGYLEKIEDYSDYAFPWSIILPVEKFLVKKSHFIGFVKRKITDFLKSVRVGSNFLNFGEAQLELEKIYYLGEKRALWEKAKREFERMKNLAEVNGVKFIVAVFPFAPQLYEEDKEPQETINRFFDESGIVYMDLLDVFKENKEKQLFRPGDYNHPSRAGHNLIAHTLYARIYKQ